MALPHSGNWDAAGVWFIDYLGGPFMTVAERLKPESLYRRFLDYRESPGLPGRAAHRRPAAEHRGAPRLAGRRRGHLPARRPRTSAAAGVPVDFFGRTATMPGGAALLAAQTGAALIPTVCQFTERGWRLVVLPGDPRRRPRPAQGPGRPARCSRSPTRSPTSIARQPEDWHMLGRIWADVPAATRRAGVARLMRIGLVCPYQWDVPGGVQYHVRDLAETLRGMGHHVEVLTPAEREESLAEEWITFAGPHGAGPVQRLDGQHAVRPGLGRPGAPMAARGALRRRPRARAGAAVGVAAGLHDRQGPDRRHLPRRDHPVEVAGRPGARWSGPWLERISGRIAVSDFARRVQVEHLGGDAVIIPNGVHVAAFADGPSLPGVTRGVDGPTIGFLGRFDEPRKGLPVLLEAMRTVVRRHPGRPAAGRRPGRRRRASRDLIGEDLRAARRRCSAS